MSQKSLAKIFNNLVCPATGGKLIYYPEKNLLLSPLAKLAYPIKNGIPVMVIDEASALSDEMLEDFLKNN